MRPAAPIVATLVGLTGCTIVFGLEAPDRRDASIDGPRVTGRYAHRNAYNDTNFVPVVMLRTVPVAEMLITATLDNGSPVTVDYREDGTFSFPRTTEDQRYQLAITVDGRPFKIEHTAGELDILLGTVGRPNPRPLAPSTVVFPYPTASSAQSPAMIASTGVWTNTVTTLYGPTVSFDWRLAYFYGPPGLLDTSENDRLYAIELGTDLFNAGVTSRYIQAVSQASVTMNANSTNNLPQPVPVSRDKCVRFATTNVEEYTRLMTTLPRTYDRGVAHFNVQAVPDADLGLQGPFVAFGQTTSGITNNELTVLFHDPFRGDLVLDSYVSLNFMLRLGSGTTTTLANLSRRAIALEPSLGGACPSPALMITRSVGIATNLKLDGVALDQDGKTVTIDRTQRARLTWDLPDDSPVDYTLINVYEILDDAIALEESIIVVTGELTLPNARFEAGRTYIIAASTVTGGFTNPKQGIFTRKQLPLESAVTWSHAFTVAP